MRAEQEPMIYVRNMEQNNGSGERGMSYGRRDWVTLVETVTERVTKLVVGSVEPIRTSEWIPLQLNE